MKTFYFMSGLPRSGSTLLTALLNQNPNIHASTNSPLLDLIYYTEEYLMCNSEQYKANPNPIGGHKVISSIPHNYYSNVSQNIIIDKSRGWSNKIDYIKKYITPDPKLICPVRSIVDILGSFISLIEKSNTVSFVDEGLISQSIEINNDNRCELLMSFKGCVRMYYHTLSEAFRLGYDKHLLLIEYDDLIQNPQREMNRIHKFLNIPSHSYDFLNIQSKENENDLAYGLNNMHDVRSKIGKIHRDNSKYLSETIMNKYKHMEFWRTYKKNYSVFGL